MKALKVLSEKLEALKLKRMGVHQIHFNSGLGETKEEAKESYLKENKVRPNDFLIFIEIPSDEMIRDRIKTYGKLN